MWRHTLQSLISLNQVPWRWSAGAQAAIATGVPLAVFTLAGHQPLGLIAVLGAFTALYGANLRLVDRRSALPLVAAGFVIASTVGVLGAANAWLTIACLITVAVLASSFALRVGLGPPGPMQFVLVAGISGHLVDPERLGGASVHGPLVPLLVAAGAISSYLLVIAPLALPSVRRREGKPAGLRTVLPLAPFDEETGIIATRVVTAVAIASVVSLPLGVNHAYWVVMVAGAILQASHVRRLTVVRAVQRMLGTFVGVAVFALLVMLQPSDLWLVAVVMLFQFAIEVMVGRNYGLALIFITPLALMISAAVGTDDALILAGERIADTLLGAFIAMVVLWMGEWVWAQIRR